MKAFDRGYLALKQIDVRTLAIGLSCYVKGWATLDFPGSDRAHPAYWVWLQRSTITPKSLPIKDGNAFQFPLNVRWDIWRAAVVPLFVDFQPPGDGSFESLVNVLETELRGRLKLTGFLP